MKKHCLLFLGAVALAIPLLSFAISSPTNFTLVSSGANVALSWTNPVEDFDHVEVRGSTLTYPTSIVDGNPVTNGTMTNYTDLVLGDGTYYYSVFAIDTGSLVSDPLTGSVVVDTTSPHFVSASPSTSVVGLGGLFFSFEVTDDNGLESVVFALLEAALPNDEITSAALLASTTGSTFTGWVNLNPSFHNLESGSYIARYTATDVFGNETIEDMPFNYDPEVIDDGEGPEIVINSPMSGERVGTNAPFSWTMSDPNMNGGSVGIVIAGDINYLFLAYQNTIFINSDENPYLISGVITLPVQNFYRHVVATDAVGNQTDSGPIFFRIDGTAPWIFYAGEAVNEAVLVETGASTTNLERNTTDMSLTGGSYAVYVSTGGNFTQLATGAAMGTTSVPLDIEAPTIYTWYATVTDKRGNITTGEQQVFYVLTPDDTTGPYLTYITPSDGVFTGVSPLDISVEVGDDSMFSTDISFEMATDSGFEDIVYIFTTTLHSVSTGYATGNYTLPFYPYEDGGYYRRAIATDTLGNVTTGAIRSFTMNVYGPSIDYSYTGAIGDRTSAEHNEDILIGANVSDAYLSGGHAHIYIGTEPDISATWPVNGLYDAGVDPTDDTTSISMNFAGGFLPPGVYYWYVDASDDIGNSTTGYTQMFIIDEPTPTRSHGGGGGVASLDKDTCIGEDKSGSSFDHKCFDNTGIPLSQRQTVLSLFASGTTATDSTSTLTVYGFITDVFKLLGVSYHGTMSEKYKTTPLAENFYNKVLARLYKIFVK